MLTLGMLQICFSCSPGLGWCEGLHPPVALTTVNPALAALPSCLPCVPLTVVPGCAPCHETEQCSLLLHCDVLEILQTALCSIKALGTDNTGTSDLQSCRNPLVLAVVSCCICHVWGKMMVFCAISSLTVALSKSLPVINKSKLGSGQRWRKSNFLLLLLQR